MKRFIGLLSCILLCSGVFAADIQSFLDFGVSGVFITEKSDTSGIAIKTQATSIGISMSMRLMFSQIAGIYTGFDVHFPQRLTTTINGLSVSVSRDNYDKLFGGDIFVGPAIMPIRTDKFGLTIAPGFHAGYMFFATSNASISGWNFGLGADVSGEYYMTPKLYLKGGVGLIYDFYATMSTISRTPNTQSGSTSVFTVKPTLAIGYRS